METLSDAEGKEYQFLKQGMDLSSFYPYVLMEDVHWNVPTFGKKSLLIFKKKLQTVFQNFDFFYCQKFIEIFSRFAKSSISVCNFFVFSSLEWDLMALTSKRQEQLYPGCCGQDFYIDITFEIALRRKALFYTVNLVIPCMLFGR